MSIKNFKVNFRRIYATKIGNGSFETIFHFEDSLEPLQDLKF